MFPVPSEDRSIPNKFGRCVYPVERPLPSSNYHSHYPIYQRDTEAAVFHKHPTHVLWSHFSVPDGDWQYYGSRKHVLPSLQETKESKKRCRNGCNMEPASPTALRKLLPFNGEGLAAPRAEVQDLAQRFSESPFKLSEGELKTYSPETKHYSQPSRLPLDPNLRASVNPITMEGGSNESSSSLSPMRGTGKRMLLSPISDSPNGLSRSPSSLNHAGSLEPTSLGFSGSDEASASPKIGKRLIYGQPAYDPLGFISSHGGKYPELAKPVHREKFFGVAQQKEQQRLDEKRARTNNNSNN